MSGEFKLAYYAGDRKTGSVHVVERQRGKTRVMRLPVAAESRLEAAYKPVWVGVTPQHEVVLWDPRTHALSVVKSFPVDAFPAHVYPAPANAKLGGARVDWFMNDGDKETGNDRLHCGENGSSVTAIAEAGSADARWLGTVCVGRGHHQAEFIEPSAGDPDAPKLCCVSNLNDGTVSLIENDPAKRDFLSVIATINLCEPEKEADKKMCLPNKSFPHGLFYSAVSRKLYCLNNGYGSVAVIDPKQREIEKRFDFKGHSNLFGTPDGRYLFGRGADRKSDPDHVIASLSVFDVHSENLVDQIKLPDTYLSKYFFNPTARKLYFTTATSGSPEQQKTLKTDAVLVFDLAHLPKLTLSAEIRLGAGCGTMEFIDENTASRYAFASCDDGSLAVMDAQSDRLLEKIAVTGAAGHTRLCRIDEQR